MDERTVLLGRLARVEEENQALRERLARLEERPDPAPSALSRRQLLRAAGAGIGTAALGAVALTGIAAPAGADQGDVVHVGDQLGGAITTTSIKNSKNYQPVLEIISEHMAGLEDSGGGRAIVAASDFGAGVFATSRTEAGVVGGSDAGDGVWGTGGRYGVHGVGPIGVRAIAVRYGTGVYAFSGLDGPDHVNPPEAPAKTAVFGFAGEDAAAVGVRGASTRGRGGMFSGARAAVQLKPSSAASHPASGSVGDLFVDRSGRLWFCKGGSRWKQLA